MTEQVRQHLQGCIDSANRALQVLEAEVRVVAVNGRPFILLEVDNHDPQRTP